MRMRPYQQDAYDAVLEAQARDVRRPLVVMATGLGKTVLFSHLADRFRQAGRVMVLAHRRELVKQAAEKLEAVTGITPAVEMGDERAESWFDRKPPVVVSSIQTHDSRDYGSRRRDKFDPAEFSLVIFDEAHRATATSWRRTVEHYAGNPGTVLLFVTATPRKLDGSGVAEELVFSYGIRDGIRDGWLVPIDHMMAQIRGLDFSRCKVRGGDFVESDVAAMMEQDKPLLEMAGCVAKEVKGGDLDNPLWHLGRPGIVFMPSVASAKEMAGILNREGYIPGKAGVVWGQQPEDERNRIVAAFRNRQIHVLVNCGVFLEGFDAARIGFVVPRPTMSRDLYEQMIGRGTRPLPKLVDVYHDSALDRLAALALSPKPSVRILDFYGIGHKRNLVTALNVLAPPDADAEELELAYRDAQKRGCYANVAESLEESRRKMAARREAAKRLEEERANRLARRKHVVPGVDVEYRRIDPFGAVSEDAPIEQRVSRGPSWLPATEKQVRFARKLHLEFHDKIRRGELSRMIDEELGRRRDGLAWASDIRELAKHGIDAREMTHEQALRRMVAQRRPAGIA